MILNKKYKDEINKIRMNDDMKKRILQNVLAANENDNSAEQNIKVKNIIPKVKKYNNIKRNMQMVAACSAVFICLSVAKNYPMLLKDTPNDLAQKETTKSQDDENNDLKTSENNEFVSSKDSKEISNNNHKEEQALVQNDNGDSYVKEQSNTNSKIGQEEKSKDNLKLSSASETQKSQTSQNEVDKSQELLNNNDKVIENSNISLKTNPEENNYNKKNENPTSTESKTVDEEVKENKIPENDSDNSVLGTESVVEQAVIYDQEYKTLEEAEKALNLKVNPLKTLPKDLKMESISVISNEIIQVKYNNNIIFRAGKGIDNISGDYSVYQVKDTAKVNGINITLEGNKSKEYNLATWEKDGISYSISAENGIDEKTILNMIL
ncbi:hypothetical protein DIC82_12110 [Clostridium beijerinckii]|nr:hypothetical protein DIC82_12110 [Clostridium beijerinckii]